MTITPSRRARVVGCLLASLLAVAFASATPRAQLQSPEMRQLADTAGVGPQVVRWCPIDPGAGRRRAYAVAVKAASGGGRYLVLDADGRVITLAPYAGDVDLSCYPRERADELAMALRQSDAIDGAVSPRWGATVICAFVENTQAVCWQPDPDTGRYVEVGRWRT